MSRVVLGLSLALLLFFAYLTAIRPAYALAYALGLLFLLAWVWPKLAARGVRIQRTLDAGTPTVGEAFEETFTVRKQGRVPAPWVEVMDLSRLTDYQPGRVLSLGRQAVTWTARGVYPQRGWVTFGPTLAVASEAFGLFTAAARMCRKDRGPVCP